MYHCKKIWMVFFALSLLLPCAVSAAENPPPQAREVTLFSVITEGDLVSDLVWLMLLAVSFAALVLLLRCLQLLMSGNFLTRRDLAIAARLDDGIAPRLIAGDLRQSGTVFAATLHTVLNNLAKGEEKAGEIAASVIQQEIAVITRAIGSLQMCGNIAPMLGLLGTVTGMVSAFMGLGTNVGAEKASVLAISIAQALYTTAAGLLVAVPALVVAHLAQNMLDKRAQEVATRIESATAKLWN